MLWQWSPSVIAELAAAAVVLVMAIYFPWREINRRASLIGVTLLLVCALWVLSHAVEIGMPVPSYKSYLMGAQLIWGTIAITFWLLYIVFYIGPRKWLTKKTYILLCVMPFIIILGVWTNHIHHLIWSKSGLDSQNPYLPLQPTYGIIYWICMVYVVVLTLTGSSRLIWGVIRLHQGRSRESVGLLIAAVLPMLAAVVETLGLSSSLKLSIGITPWASFIGTIILVWNLPRFHLRDVIPFARDTLFERLEDYIIVLDKWDRVMDLNPAAERFVGHKVSDVLGFSVKQIFPQWPTQIGINDQATESYKEIILARGGEQRTFNLSVSIVSDPDGHSTSKVVLLADITYRKKVEEELKKANINLELAIGASQIGIWELDLIKDTSVRNKRHDQIFGYTEELAEWGAKIFFEHIILEDRPSVQAAFDKAMKTDRLFFECRILWPDKSIHWITATGKAVRDSAGKPQKMFGTVTDITERKRAEESIQASLQEKDVMLREIHHRVKNNLHVISSLFNLQAGQTQSREYREILKGGQTRVQAMSLVHEKLYQSHDLSKIDLATYIRSLAVLLFQSYRIDFNQVRLEMDFEEVSLDINSAVPCGLILNELISNSLKHAFPEDRKGKIRLEVKHGSDDTIILRVADDGIGFPKNLDFRQSESFGLQIANLLVGQLEGTIELDRTKGTAFTVTFRELKYAPRI